MANIVKSFSEISEKLDSLIQRMGAVEQWVSDLEDVSAETAPRMTTLEVQLQKVVDRLDTFENQSQVHNLRIMDLRKGMEGRTSISSKSEY